MRRFQCRREQPISHPARSMVKLVVLQVLVLDFILPSRRSWSRNLTWLASRSYGVRRFEQVDPIREWDHGLFSRSRGDPNTTTAFAPLAPSPSPRACCSLARSPFTAVPKTEDRPRPAADEARGLGEGTRGSSLLTKTPPRPRAPGTLRIILITTLAIFITQDGGALANRLPSSAGTSATTSSTGPARSRRRPLDTRHRVAGSGTGPRRWAGGDRTIASRRSRTPSQPSILDHYL
ncbi:hypothetical protein GGR56DRAFT_85496 [Xylariaceae sp. FL0804]|nr:hypothetical protein GGR56DRAFT_85496 [Xylariaceae sp. FL0804]